ncbi:hypothetical protein M3Y96_00838800 [Aphelenchoides besseyi]|nr:hypothetical protein M3Y96_00838800 [Aphelenchoides besseyi]
MDVQEGESETNQKKEGAEPTKKADETSDRSKNSTDNSKSTFSDIVMSVETILGVHVTKDFEKVFGVLLSNGENTILHMKSWNDIGSTLMAGLSVDKVYAFRDLKAEKKTFSRGNTVCDVKFTKNSSYELIGNKIQETFEFVQLADVAIHVGKFLEKKGQKVKVKGRYSDPFVVMDMWTVLQDEALELNNPQLRAFKTPTRKRKCA